MRYAVLYGATCFVLVLVLLGGRALAIHTVVDASKASPFECGFDAVGSARIPFCMKFFLVAVVFLIFDVEVALILPILVSALGVVVFLVALVVSTLYEWGYGGLTWMA